MENNLNASGDSAGAYPLIRLALTLSEYKRVLLLVPLALGLMSVLIAALLPNWYTATAKIMPPQQSQSTALAILGQFGALTGGASQALGIKNPSDIYVVMLKSRTIADNLITEFKLK